MGEGSQARERVPGRRSRQSHLVDLTPLRVSPAFARLWIGNTLAGIGAMVTATAVGLNIYDLTQSTFMVSLVAWFALVPMIVAGLYGGAIADHFDRRLVALTASSVAWSATLALALIAWAEVTTVWPFYVITTVNAVAATIASATRQAIIPRLLPLDQFPKAAALMGISFGVMVTAGPRRRRCARRPRWLRVDLHRRRPPLLRRVLRAVDPAADPAGAERGGDARARPPIGRRGPAPLETAPNVRMSFVVDIIAMTFGQPTVLFPAVGAVVIGGGTVTAGLLFAAYAVGGIISSLGSGRLTGIRWQGRAIRNAIVVYGLAILGLGVVLAVVMLGGHSVTSRDFADVNRPALALALLCLAVAGGADNVSAIFRQTILQAAVPDRLRGRMQGIFTVVVTGGPRLGQMLAGSLATLTVIWVPPVVGGILVVVLVILAVARVPSFRDYDALDPRP